VKEEFGFHKSVMCEEIVAAIAPSPAGVYVDATLGGGGHSAALLNAGAGRIIALDMDGEALAYVGRELACFAERLSLHFLNFSSLSDVLQKENIEEIQGAVFDLGLSWHQVRSESRGFSYQGEGPLDMRFNPEGNGRTALEIIRSEPQEAIERILRDYGEEPRARRISEEICRYRKNIQTTKDLSNLLRKMVGQKEFRKTASRVYQALRIAVNEELVNLNKGLTAAIEHLAKNGRIAVLSYHSLEDRIVKNCFRDKTKEGGFRKVNKKPITASLEELKSNPAARSAKLRILERL